MEDAFLCGCILFNSFYDAITTCIATSRDYYRLHDPLCTGDRSRKCNVAQSISLSRGGGSFTVSWRNLYVEGTWKNFSTEEIEWERRARRRQTRRSIRLPVGIVVFRQSILAGEVSSRDATRTRGINAFSALTWVPLFEPHSRLILAYNVKRRLGDANLVVVKYQLSLVSYLQNLATEHSVVLTGGSASIVQARRRETTVGKSKRDVNSPPRKKHATKKEQHADGQFTTHLRTRRACVKLTSRFPDV